MMNECYRVEIEIPENVKLDIDGKKLTIKGAKGELSKTLDHPAVAFETNDGKLVVKYCAKKMIRETKMYVHTFRSITLAMIKGVCEGYTAKLKVCSGHFPMTASVSGNKLVIKNYFGEKVPRKVALIHGVKVKVNGDIIEVEGIDKNLVGQMAAKIEQTAVVKNRDRRIFQDGCYIIEKPK